MAEYDFEDADGDVTTREYRVGKAPGSVRHKGRKYKRAYLPQSVAKVGKVRQNLHFTARSMEPWVEGAPRYDDKGRAQFASRREVDEFIDKSQRANDTDADYRPEAFQWTEDDRD
jgi:hypothetical protein